MFRSPLADGLVVLIVLLLFFGPKRLPELGKGIGEGIRGFKDGIGGSDKAELTPPESETPAAERDTAESGAERSS